MKKFILLVFLFPLLLMAQENNEKVLFHTIKTYQDFAEVIKETKEKNKIAVIIFINKNFISKTSFANFIDELKEQFNKDSLADVVNKNFVCNILLFDNYDKRSTVDNKFISELITGCRIGKNVMYFLYANSKGEIIHKNYFKYFTRDGKDGKDGNFFLSLKEALDSTNHCYTLLKKFKAGERDTGFIKHFFHTLTFSADDSTDQFVLDYINSQKNIYTKTNADIIMGSFAHFAAFNHIYQNHDKWAEIISENYLDSFYRHQISNIIRETYYWVYNFRFSSTDSIVSSFQDKYPKYGRLEAVLFFLNQYSGNNPIQIELYDNIVNHYFDLDIIKELSASQLNNIAWHIFQYSLNSQSLFNASNLSKQCLVIKKNNPMYLDTYANLLYKLGHTKEAIEIEEQALELAETSNKKNYEKVIDKMKNGNPTWK